MGFMVAGTPEVWERFLKVLLLQLDGKMPNLALMRIAAHHREQGDFVYLQQVRREGSAAVERGLFDQWDKVYASLIFTKSQPIARRLQEVYPDAVIGGTGWNFRTLEDLGIGEDLDPDYSIYPNFRASIGFTQRGCRLNCDFCVVPQKEGKVKSVASVSKIWRGEPWPSELILLDNDFFGQPDWMERCKELRVGEFKVCFTQGINARMLNPLAAQALGRLRCTDDSFKRRRIYTAWDNIGDEGPLFRGLKALTENGFKPDEIMVYVLIGHGDDDEESRLYRQSKLREFGCRPYPMPFVRTPELVGFQRWVVGAYDKRIPWEAWRANGYRPEGISK